MEKESIELYDVINAAIKSTVDIDSNTSLSDLYAEKKKALHLSDRQIQHILNMDPKTLNPILKGTAKHASFINVIKVAHFLGLSVNDLLKIYIPKMDADQIREIQRSRDGGYIVETFDVATLIKMKFFSNGSSSQEMGDKIKKFFCLDSLYDYSKKYLAPAFSRTKRNSSDLMRNFWVQSAYAHFVGINNPYSYNRKELVELIPKIKPYTRDVKNGLVKVVKALYRVGVTVIYQSNLERVQVRGATMVYNEKPCIVLSNLQNNYPTLWFTLLHELYHVLYDLDSIAMQTYHLSDDEGDLFLVNEEGADNFARDYFLNESRLKFVSAYIGSPISIEELAKRWGIHPSIIYAIYCYKTNRWALYNQYIPKMTEAIELLNTHPFEKESLKESIQEMKDLIFNI